MSVTRQSAGQNRLLDKLSAPDLDSLLPYFRPVELKGQGILLDSGQKIECLYFPLEGLISIVSLMRDGSIIEIGAIGREGAAGTPILLCRSEIRYRHCAQIGGTALQIGADVVIQQCEQSPSLRQALLQYHGTLMVLSMQNAACNGLHNVEQRCCKWLLLTMDRVGLPCVEMTHERLGHLLGVRRATVSEVLKPLRDSGLLTYSRGAITVKDREGLMGRACECYALVAREYAWLQ